MKTAAPEKKSVKTLKGQLFGAVSMMLVAAIALGTSTYAWFVNNQTAEIQNMQLTVSSASSLQIAVKKQDASGYTTYKNLLTPTDITGGITSDATSGAGWTKMFSEKMKPATASNLTAATGAFFYSSDAMTGNSLSVFKAITAGNVNEVKIIPLSFLTTKDSKIYFGAEGVEDIFDMITPSYTAPETNPTTEETAKAAASLAQATAIRKALRVSVFPTTAGVTEAKIFQFDDVAGITGMSYNTYYDKVTKVDTATTGLPAAISAIQAIGDTGGKYAAISKIFAAADAANNILAGMPEEIATQTAITTAAAKTDYLATVTDPTTIAKPAGDIALFELKANTAMDVTVCIWLEGTDQDCVSALSDYQFNLSLPFAAIPKPVTP